MPTPLPAVMLGAKFGFSLNYASLLAEGWAWTLKLVIHARSNPESSFSMQTAGERKLSLEGSMA